MPNTHVELIAVPDIPLIQTGDDLSTIMIDCLHNAGYDLVDGDILVISSKIISKSEGRFVDLKQIIPSPEAQQLAVETHKDPRLVQLILNESQKVSRYKAHVLVVKHRLGFTSANAGIDASNIETGDPDLVLLLPESPDASAQHLHEELTNFYGVRLGIVVSDTHGRPHRFGNVGVAIGVAGMPALIDQRGDHDLYGRELMATMTPLADELATAAGLVSGQADEGQPVVLIRGVAWENRSESSNVLIRPSEQDLYD